MLGFLGLSMGWNWSKEFGLVSFSTGSYRYDISCNIILSIIIIIILICMVCGSFEEVQSAPSTQLLDLDQFYCKGLG